MMIEEPSPDAFLAGTAIDLSWYVRALESDKKRSETVLLDDVDVGINKLLSDGNFITVDLILICTDPNLLSPELGETFARSTYAARDRLSSWGDYVNRLKAAFAFRELDVKDFIGI